MTEGAPRLTKREKRNIKSPERNEVLQAMAQQFQQKLQLGALEILAENRNEAKNKFNIDSTEDLKSFVHSGVIILNERGELVGKAGRFLDADKRINGASATKVVNSLFMLMTLYEQGYIDLNDLDKPQLPSKSRAKCKEEGIENEYNEKGISVREYLVRVLGYSDNDQLGALRELYVSHYGGVSNKTFNAMDALSMRINQALNITAEKDKFIPRGSTKSNEKDSLLGNTAPLKTILEGFRYSVELCKSKEGYLPKEFREVFLSSLKTLPEEIVSIGSNKSLRLLHTFKRQNPKKGIKEKSGWFADQGDSINTINSFSEIQIDGKIYYIGWYVEAPEVIKKSHIRFPVLSEYEREYQQWKFMKNAGEVIKAISNRQEFKLFT